MGGFDVIKSIISELPPDFSIPIFIVWHMSPDVQGVLPQVLNKLKTINASNAVDGELILPNHIYVAPPDHHMLIEKDSIKVSRGPKENLFRPAIDPLFRSAAVAYGKRVIGIVLSGGLDDGTSGLWQVKAHGGIAIVQDPEDAAHSSMPKSALQAVKVDHCLPASALAGLLVKLAKLGVIDDKNFWDEKSRAEIDIAAAGNAIQYGADSVGKLSPYSCPECHGVMSRIMEDNIIRFRCHTGHAYTSDSLLLALGQRTEESLYNVLRGMEETIFLLNHMGDHYAEANEPKLAAAYFLAAKKSLLQSNTIKDAIHAQELLSSYN